MQIKEFLDSVCEQIKYKPIRENIAEELKNHIEEVKENYMQEGLEETTAEEKAIEQMGEAQEIGKKLNKIHKPKLDWKLLLIVCVLLCFGFLVVQIRIENSLEFYSTQISISKYIFFLIIGIVLGIAIYFIDYTKLSKYPNIFYLIATGTIIYALVFGVNVNGIPYIYATISITFSPAVIAIPLYIIAFVGFINNLNKENKLSEIISKYINIKVNMNLVKIIILSILSLGFLALIPSMASVLVLGLTYLILATVKIMQVKENKIKNIVKLWGTVTIVGMCLLIFILVTSPFILERITVTTNPESDPHGGGWVAMNRKTIIESAKMFGEAENKSNALYLFDEGTDFAFISILAHYGWTVSIAIVLAIIALSIKLILNAIKIKDNYGKLLIIGISSMFILHAIFNILMNLNLWIESGFNFPFVSYGGANLVINMMSLALILSIYRKKDIIIMQNMPFEKE